MVAGRLSWLSWLLVAVFLMTAPATLHAKKKRKRQAAPSLKGPKRLVLGVDRVAVLHLHNSVPDVRFYTNVGQIVSVKNTKGGVEAAYQPPESAFPQVAIVVAASPDHSLFEWIAIPLYGRPKIKIQSIRRADVVAKIGEESFGPVRTDNKGDAQLQLIVPPGLQEVALTTTDRLGTVSKSTAALHAPSFGRLLAICPEGDANAIRVVATNSEGEPLRKARVQLEASIDLGKSRAIRPGVYAAPVPAGSELDPPNFTLKAGLEGSPKFTSECEGKRPGSLPSALRVRLAEESFRAGSGASIRVTVELDYDNTQRRRSPALVVETSLGTVTPLRSKGDLLWATWDLPDGFAGQQEATIEVRSKREKTLVGKGKLLLQAGPLASLEVRASSRSFIADGSNKTKVVATLLDIHGNGVIGTPPVGDDTEGLSPFTPTREAGRYLADYQPPRSYLARKVDLIVREPKAALESRVSIDLVPARRRFLAELLLGYTTNAGLVRAPSGSLALATRLPLGKHYAVIGASVGLLRSRSTEEANDGSDLEFTLLGTPIFGTVAYERVMKRATFFGGFGGGVVYSRTKLSSATAGERTLVNFTPAGLAFLGARYRLGPGHLVGHLSYARAPIESEGVRGELLGLSAQAGYGFDL